MVQKTAKLRRIAILALPSIGIIALVLSVFFVSSFVTLIGVSFIFWGLIIYYLLPEKHVPVSLLNNSNSIHLNNLNRIVAEYKIAKKGIYLPPKNLKVIESSIVYLPKNEDSILPTAAELQNGLLTEKKDGFLFQPPGLALCQFLEHELGYSFITSKPSMLPTLLPKLLVTELSLAESFDVSLNEKTVVIKVGKSVFENSSVSDTNSSSSQDIFGDILSSAMACILAKVIGRTIQIQKMTFDSSTNETTYEYQIGSD
jgi:hypothetical protein